MLQDVAQSKFLRNYNKNLNHLNITDQSLKEAVDNYDGRPIFLYLYTEDHCEFYDILPILTKKFVLVVRNLLEGPASFANTCIERIFLHNLATYFEQTTPSLHLLEVENNKPYLIKSFSAYTDTFIYDSYNAAFNCSDIASLINLCKDLKLDICSDFSNALVQATELHKSLLIFIHNEKNELSKQFISLLLNDDHNDFFYEFTICALECEKKKDVIREIVNGTNLSYHEIIQGALIVCLPESKLVFQNVITEIVYPADFLKELFLYLDKSTTDLREYYYKIQNEAVNYKSIPNVLIRNFDQVFSHLECPAYKYKIFVISLSKGNDHPLISAIVPDYIKLFRVIPWNISKDSYIEAFKYFTNQTFEANFTYYEDALYFFIIYNENGNATFRQSLKISDIECVYDCSLELATSFIQQNEITDYAEFEADTSGACRTLESYTEQAIRNRKVFALLLCGSKDQLSSKAKAKLLNKAVVLEWNIKNEELMLKLRRAADRVFDLPQLTESIVIGESKDSKVFLFIPLGESLCFYTTVNYSIFLDKFINEVIQFNSLEQQFGRPADGSFTPFLFQQNMCENLNGRDYDCFMEDERDALKKKITFALKGPPNSKEEKEDPFVEKTYMKIVAIGEKLNPKYKKIFLSCVFACWTPLTEDKVKKLQKLKKDDKYNPNTDIAAYPIFILQKCFNSKKHCRIIIDHGLREYKNWDQYLDKNKLPKGIIYVPSQGRYSFNAKETVVLSVLPTPECGFGPKLLKGVDIGGTVAGVATGTLLGVTAVLSIPLAAPVVATAVGVSIASGVTAVARSSWHIYDRVSHKEDLSISNSEARAAYFNIAGGSLMLISSGASMVLTRLASNGATVGNIARGTVNSLNGATILITGGSVVDGSYQTIKEMIERKNVSTLQLLQLTTSILFFAHATYSFKSANTIINEAQLQEIQSNYSSLTSNKQRRIFDKLTKETIRTAGNEQIGRAELIRTLKKIDIPATMNILSRNNKMLNENNVRFAAKDGDIYFNGERVNVFDFGRQSFSSRVESVSNIPMSECFSPNYKGNMNYDYKSSFTTQLFEYATSQSAISFIKLMISNCSVKQKVLDIIGLLSNGVQKWIIKQTLQLIDCPELKELFEKRCFNTANKFVTILSLILEGCVKFSNIQEVNVDNVKQVQNTIIEIMFLPRRVLLENFISYIHKVIQQWLQDKMVQTNETERCRICDGLPIASDTYNNQIVNEIEEDEEV